MQTTEFKIRTYSPQDIGDIKDIEDQCFIKNHSWSIDEIQEFISTGNKCLVICRSSSIVGFVMYRKTNICFQVWSIAVCPEFRRRGLGSELMTSIWNEMCVSRIRRRRIVASVPDVPSDSVRFFLSLGFTTMSIMKDCYAKGVNGHTMLAQPDMGKTNHINRLRNYFQAMAITDI